MNQTRKRWLIIAIGLAVAVVFVALTVNQAGAATPVDPDPTVGTPATIDLVGDVVPLRSGMHCWQIEVDQQIRSAAGKVRAWPKMEAEWCTGKNYATITDLVYLRCGSRGGYFSFDWCKKSHGSLGYPSLATFGSWHYHWLVSGIGTFDLTPDLSMQLYPNGHAVGTWSWQ